MAWSARSAPSDGAAGQQGLVHVGWKPLQRNVQRTYANEVRDNIMRRTRQMSGAQSHNRRVQFLAGVEVREVSMDDSVKANEAFRPVWRG